MAHVRFQEVSITTEKQGKCCVCNKSCKVKKKFYQTLSPFNRNAGGSVKNRQEIILEISAERDAWLIQPPKHKKCEQALGQQPLQEREDE